MLKRVTAANGAVYYASPLLSEVGVPHAFSTRVGGVSTGVFASLNLGNPGGVPIQDSHDNITRNYQLLHAAIGCETRQRVFTVQIHGACVLDPSTSKPTDSIHGGVEIGRGDGLVTDDVSKLLSVRTADCVPVLIATRDGRRVAAVHAGWRGVASGVVTETLKHFANPRDLIAAIGPAIGYDVFEVGCEVVEAIVTRLGIDVPNRKLPDGTWRIDLQSALQIELGCAGVSESQIDTTDRCTVTHTEEFFSHRREQGLTGRMASVIGAIQ